MISVDRAKTILECYGGNPYAWPLQERDALQQAIAGSQILQSLQQEAVDLDQFMGFLKQTETSIAEQTIKQCSQRILNALPEQSVVSIKQSRKKQGLFNVLINSDIEKSRPTLMVATILLAVIGLSNNMQYTESQNPDSLSLSDYLAIYVIESDSKESNIANNFEAIETLAFLEPELLEEDS